MRQRASDTINHEIKTNIYMFSQVCFFYYKCQNENIMITPKQISISDKSMLFDGCPTAKLGKK